MFGCTAARRAIWQSDLISTIRQSSRNFTFLPFISVVRDFESDRLSLGQDWFSWIRGYNI